MKKIIVSALAALLISFLFVSCQSTEAPDENPQNETLQNETPAENGTPETETQKDVPVRVAMLKGPTGMGAAKLMSDKAEDSGYTFTLAGSPDEITAMVINGTVDIAAVPTNLASVLYTKSNRGIRVAALNTLGVLYILDGTGTIGSVADLKGKTIYATGQGSTPEYILKYILAKNGIDPEKDVEIVFKAEHSELSTMMAADSTMIAMLPEPNVTTALGANKDYRIALNLTEEWDAVAGGESMLVQGCLVVSKDFAENHKDTLDRFLKEYKASVSYVTENPEEASLLIEQLGIIPKAAIAKAAIPNCNITFIDGNEMKSALEGFLTVLLNFNPKSVGGELPDDAFYYQK